MAVLLNSEAPILLCRKEKDLKGISQSEIRIKNSTSCKALVHEKRPNEKNSRSGPVKYQETLGT